MKKTLYTFTSTQTKKLDSKENTLHILKFPNLIIHIVKNIPDSCWGFTSIRKPYTIYIKKLKSWDILETVLTHELLHFLFRDNNWNNKTCTKKFSEEDICEMLDGQIINYVKEINEIIKRVKRYFKKIEE